MISRFVLWDNCKTPSALPADLSAVLGEEFAMSNAAALSPDSLPSNIRLAIRKHLLDSGTGAEVVLSRADGRPTLRITSHVTIAELELSVRSHNCLTKASIETLDELLTWAPARLMELPNFGRKCMDEITDVLCRLGCPYFGDETSPAVARQKLPFLESSAPIACLFQVRELVSEGFPECLVAHGWQSLADLALHSVETLVRLTGISKDERLRFEHALFLLSLELPIAVPPWLVYNMNALRSAFHEELDFIKSSLSQNRGVGSFQAQQPVSRSLNEELLRLIPRSFDDRNMRIVAEILGLGGNDPLTLDEVAKAQTPPMTRERVRQILLPITDILNKRGRELPWLSKAIETLRQTAPCSLEQADRVLSDDGIIEAPMTVPAILGLARRANLEHGLLLEGGILQDSDAVEMMATLVSVAGKLSSRWGVVDWRELEALVPKAATFAVKTHLREVVWLDAKDRYFVLPGRENSLANRLARILAIAPRLRLAEAYRGVFRDARMDNDRLPEELFAAFCGVWPWCSVEGNEVVVKPGLPDAEVSGDDLLVLLLSEIGRPIRRRELTRRAIEHGIGREVVINALSYSNVIASVNGYFSVIGDPRLEEFSRDSVSVAVEDPGITIGAEDIGLVPDESAVDLVGQLLLAVEERVAALELTAPWSASELRFNERDRSRLLAWGRFAEWDFRCDIGSYQTKSNAKVPKRAALGLAFLLFASEAVRRSQDSDSVWPAIEDALGEHQQELFMVRPSMPRLQVREAVESACRTFGLRHGFEDVGRQVWMRTFCLQSGLQCSHLPKLGEMLTEIADLQPIAIQLLLDKEGPNASTSFRTSWKLLQDARLGLLDEEATLERFRSDAWLSPFPAQKLLEHCMNAPEPHLRAALEATVIASDDPYQYFSAPVLRWASDEAYLEYSLNDMAPLWRESAALILFCEDPFRKERIPILNDRWHLLGGPVRVPLTRRQEAGFRFKLMQGKDEVFADWMTVGLQCETPFTFFRSSGAMVSLADDVPIGEEVVLLHCTDVLVTGVDAPLVFRLVLYGSHRLTRLPAGAVTRIQLLDPDGKMLWSLPRAEQSLKAEDQLVLHVRGGKWGTLVDITLPEMQFAADRLRLNNGEMLPIERANGRTLLLTSPRLGRSQTGKLHGPVCTNMKLVRVNLRHVGTDFGAALEMDGNWRPLDGSATLDVSTLRTHRLLAKAKGSLGTQIDMCWMEGARTIAGLRNLGTLLAGMHGLGESLNLVSGTYNSSQVEVIAAHAITDGGFWRSVQAEMDGSWSAHLPFEELLEEGHRLWIWTEDSLLPREIPRSRMEKVGFLLRWKEAASEAVIGWAFSFAGVRVGSVVDPEQLARLIQYQTLEDWEEMATWLRWWHAPVLHRDVRPAIARRVREHPMKTLRAWLLPAPYRTDLVFDELRDEAWATAAREFLWDWRPDPKQAAELLKVTGVMTGDIESDSQKSPPSESINLLLRMSPILLVDALKQALPELYPYPKPQLAVLLGLVLQTINPNATDIGFRLEGLCERYAKGESRLDGRFILTSLIGTARALLGGEQKDRHNLRIALHQIGLRELISTALLRDVFERWQRGVEC